LGSRPDVDTVYEDHGPENPDAPVNYGEYDREGDMAKDDLYTIDSAAEELYSILQADENLPEWVQSKITKAVDYIDTARDYMKAQSYGQGVAEGADDKFSVADKVEELVRNYKLFDERGWTDLFSKLAGKKLYGQEYKAEIYRATEYASKFLQLLDSIRMRSDYRGQQDPKKDQELIDLSNQWLDLFNKATSEYKAMSGQGVAEGSSENKYSNLSNRGVNRGIKRAGDDFNRMMDLDQVESPHYKTQHQQDTKQRLKTKTMVGPKGVLPEQDMAEASFPTVADARKRAEQEKGTGKFTSKKSPDHPSGTIYTRKYNPKSGETDDTENVSIEKRGRGRPKKSAFEDMSTIDKMIAESFGELFEGTSRPINDPVSKAAPTAPGVGSGIRVAPMPALATTPKPATGMGTIKGGVVTATPPKAGEQGVPVPQGLDEVDTEMEGMRKLAGLKGGQKKLDRDQDGELTRKDFEMLRKGLEEGGRDDYDEIRDKIQWLQGAPNYLSRDEAKETAYYTKDTDPVWDGYRDDADEVGENLDPTMPTPELDRMAAMQADPNFKPLRPGDVERSIERGAAMDKDAREQQKYKDRTTPGVINKLKDTFGVSKPNPAYAPKPAAPAPVQGTNEDDMEEGNAFSGAVARAKADGIQPGETINVDGKEYDLKEGDVALNQMRKIAGLKECGMSPVSVGAADMHDEQGSMNISTNQNSSGAKSVTITADGYAAGDLMQMLKLAGMGGGGAAPTPAPAAEPEIVVVAQDGEEAMEEEKDPRYQASTTPDEQVAPVQALTKGGNGDVAGQEKVMKPGGYQFGDNNLAMQESLSTQLMKEYNSIKVKK
jgi:hypothetical protein